MVTQVTMLTISGSSFIATSTPSVYTKDLAHRTCANASQMIIIATGTALVDRHVSCLVAPFGSLFWLTQTQHIRQVDVVILDANAVCKTPTHAKQSVDRNAHVLWLIKNATPTCVGRAERGRLWSRVSIAWT
jgi:hypothetical protein